MRASIIVKPELVGPSTRLVILVVDSFANKNADMKESIYVEATSDVENEPNRITKINNLRLTETGKNTGVFSGSIQLTPDKDKVPGNFEALPGDLVTITYQTFKRKQGKPVPITISEVVEVQSYDPEFVVDKDQYSIGDKMTVVISDPTANRDPERRDSIGLRVFSRRDVDGINIEATETGKDTGVFRASFLLSKAKSQNLAIQVSKLDEITIAYLSRFPADYVDEIEKSGNPNKAFYFSVPIGYPPLDPIQVLDHVQKYFDPTIFDRIRNGEFLPSTNKTITIAFWDIRGFSRMVDSLRTDPKMAGEFLSEYFELATDVVARNNGILDKFIGDGVMALFGVFDDPKKSPQKGAIAAVNTALDFRNGFLELLNRWRPKWAEAEEQLIDIKLGCGINTGEAFIGSLGGESRQQFTAIGRSVNIGSRLESNSVDNKILISARTLEKVKDHFVTKHFGDLELKKIDGKYPCYEVIGKATENKKES
jgi:class 3 adenylate cyclase